jgi:hypothetical protein
MNSKQANNSEVQGVQPMWINTRTHNTWYYQLGRSKKMLITSRTHKDWQQHWAILYSFSAKLNNYTTKVPIPYATVSSIVTYKRHHTVTVQETPHRDCTRDTTPWLYKRHHTFLNTTLGLCRGKNGKCGLCSAPSRNLHCAPPLQHAWQTENLKRKNCQCASANHQKGVRQTSKM